MQSPPVVAYADNVTVLVTQPGDFAIIYEAVRCYEKATGAKLNSYKSKALHMGVVQASDCTRNWVSRPSHDLGNHIWSHYCKIGERQLGRSLTVGTCTSTKSLCSNPLLRTTNTICTPMSSRENLVSGTNSPTHQGARATTYNCVRLVHLARCNLSDTCVHPTTS